MPAISEQTEIERVSSFSPGQQGYLVFLRLLTVGSLFFCRPLVCVSPCGCWIVQRASDLVHTVFATTVNSPQAAQSLAHERLRNGSSTGCGTVPCECAEAAPLGAGRNFRGVGETELFPLIEYCASDDTFHERCRIADVVL